jgi:hypothetical protein
MNPNDDPPDGSNAPYARTYFPGVSNSRDASLITVTEGAKLENLNIRLPALLKQRVITGKVVWSNGRPVPDAMVFLYNTATNREVTGVRSDQLGHFELKVYGDFKYEIDADSDSVESGKSERVKVPQSGALKPFKLVLKPE